MVQKKKKTFIVVTTQRLFFECAPAIMLPILAGRLTHTSHFFFAKFKEARCDACFGGDDVVVAALAENWRLRKRPPA